MITRLRTAAAVLALAVAATPAHAQTTATPSVDAAIEQLRKDVRAEKTDIITGTMEFSADEAAKFWPLYKKYEAQRRSIGDEKVALVKDFAATYAAMPDAKAGELLNRLLAVEDKTAAAKRQFVQELQKALSAKTAARYYQVDNRIDLLMNLELAGQIPIIKK
jgi:hypothetical protein